MNETHFGDATLYLGDCLDVLRTLPDASVDSVVTDPPYGLSFMGKRWDYDVPSVEIWAECLRVLKPGGHLLAFAGTRTQHRMAARIEDAGFEIRDMLAWLYGSGFPKSLDVSKAIDAQAGAEREVVGSKVGKPGYRNGETAANDVYGDGLGNGTAKSNITAPATEAAKQWDGWGTALKPALETVTFASKPYTDGQELDIIQSNLIRLEARLWLLSSASAAEKSSTSSQSEYGAAFAIAQWSADEITSTRAALCDPMGMSLFELATTTSLNIVSSWRRTLAESWSDGSTSTTETKSSTTTDWRTLKFSLSQITPSTIIRACSLPGGFSVNASTAESHFNASLSLLQSIRTLSATERAMSQAQHEHRDAGVKPNLDPCIMARKPLSGPVADNVMAHGTGALNIDGCRIGTEGGSTTPSGMDRFNAGNAAKGYRPAGYAQGTPEAPEPAGRWPANVLHDGSDEVLAHFPDAPGQLYAVGPEHGDKASINTYGDYGPRDNFAPRNDTGSAARFFKECTWQDHDQQQLSAGTAEQNLSLQKAVDGFALNAAATWPNLAGIQSNDAPEPSTNATPNELNVICNLVTAAIAIIGSECSREQRLEKHSPCGSLVKVVAAKNQTDTMTITASLYRLDGFVAHATSNITPINLAHGVAASRIKYCAKASKADRDEGLHGFAKSLPASALARTSQLLGEESTCISGTKNPRANTHPTVKPTDLMCYLLRLVTPPGGTALDPFMGSGSTGKAALLEHFKFIGIERDPDYFEIAKARIDYIRKSGVQVGLFGEAA